MGDAPVSCAFSGITLQHEPAVFLPLLKTERAENMIGSRLGSNLSTALFSPLTLPFAGGLDRYGIFENIEKDENTALIEKAFDLSIENFAKACFFGELIKTGKTNITGAGCFIHPEIYDRFSRPVIGGKYGGSVWMGGHVGSIHLETIGCVLDHDLGEGERYRYVYCHPAIAGIEFRSDKKFSKVIVSETGKELHVWGLNKIHVALKKAGFSPFPSKNVEEARTTQELPKILRFELEESFKRQRSRLQENYKNSRHDKEPSTEDILDFVLTDSRYLLSPLTLDSDTENLMDEYLRAFFQDKLLDQTARLQQLIKSFSSANRVLMPTLAGSQHPEDEMTLVITDYINRVAKNRARDME